MVMSVHLSRPQPSHGPDPSPISPPLPSLPHSVACTGNVTLSNGAGAVTAFKTPLRVRHAQNCDSVAPALTLQMDTTLESHLTLTVGGLDVGATLTSLLAPKDFTFTNGAMYTMTTSTSGYNCANGIIGSDLGKVPFYECKLLCHHDTTCVGISFYSGVDDALGPICRLHTSAGNCCETVGVTTGCSSIGYAWGYYKKD